MEQKLENSANKCPLSKLNKLAAGQHNFADTKSFSSELELLANIGCQYITADYITNYSQNSI